jgi:hypothetical protein
VVGPKTTFPKQQLAGFELSEWMFRFAPERAAHKSERAAHKSRVPYMGARSVRCVRSTGGSIHPLGEGKPS